MIVVTAVEVEACDWLEDLDSEVLVPVLEDELLADVPRSCVKTPEDCVPEEVLRCGILYLKIQGLSVKIKGLQRPIVMISDMYSRLGLTESI